jgi:hypothetical protein
VDQLIQQIMDRTGVSQNVARTSVQYIGGFLKGKAPQYGSQIDNFLGTQGSATPPELNQVKSLDQLAGFMSQRLGIPEGTAKSLIQVAGNYLKQKAPPPLNTQVEAALSQGKGAGFAGTAQQMPGGMSQQEQQPRRH